MKTQRYYNRSGFTIVELLVVIVVIAILAAIVIVAYNGVSNRARTSTVISDLSAVARKFKADHAVDGQYPTSYSPSSAGTSFQVSTNNNAVPQTFCITATNGTVTYKISQDQSTPVSGGCAGHGQSGQAAVTNLVANPSFESGSSGIGVNGSVAANNGTSSSSSAVSGSAVYRRQYTANGTQSNNGIYQQIQIDGTKQAYQASAYVRTSKPVAYRLAAERRNASGTGIGTVNSTPVTIPANTWTRLTLDVPVLPNMTRFTFCVYSETTTWAVNDTVEFDAFMVTEGTNTYNYADGNTQDWVWNGSVNSSTSTGPAPQL